MSLVAVRIHLLREHGLDLLVAQQDLVDGVALSLEGLEVALYIGGEEDLWMGGQREGPVSHRIERGIPGFQSKPCDDRTQVIWRQKR